jgi:signal transduction histidine kinase
MLDETLTFPQISPQTVTDLETVLAAWQDATGRLEQTHVVLRDEVKRLTDELEAKNRELARKDRLADLGQMAAHVAHEVRNNLVPVTLYLSLLRRRIAADAESLDVLAKVEAGFTALDATVNDLLHFTSDRDPHLEKFNLHRLVDDVLSSLAPQFAAQSIRPVNAVPSDAHLTADRQMIRRALLNLVLNAVDAMPEGGAIEIRFERIADGVELHVADTGSGLSEETLARAFEPFFTTKSRGTGLGLAIVYRIAEVHGGQVLAQNRPQRGAVFIVQLPQADQETYP